LQVIGPARRFVSRGGDKLRSALDRFDIDPRDRDGLDAGASTGGFTDCLLQSGAAAFSPWTSGTDSSRGRSATTRASRVMERTNVRNLRLEDLPFVPDLLVADLSFISLRTVVAALVRWRIPGPTSWRW
jgi:23S rRNA (cytidine1920-2'-O)/16S rRNA (cytidine1409-2'-O)-methyltransferase